MDSGINVYLEAKREDILRDWAHLHSIPETAFQEVQTSAWLAQRLKAAGYLVTTGVGGTTGVVGRYDTGIPGPSIGIRADMDSLRHEVAGQMTNVHSCGHDANCTAVLWAATALRACRAMEAGSLTVLFQPAEETLAGADKIIESGALKDLDYLVGIHLRPMEELPKGKISPAVLHGACGIMDITVTGENAHGARPHQGVNAVEAAALVVTAIQTVHMDPTVPHSAKATQIHSGDTPFNVIPDQVFITCDLRAQTNEAMTRQQGAVIQAAEHAAACVGAKAACSWRGGVPAAQPSPELIDLAAQAVGAVLGEQGVGPVISTSGGEDFHKYPLAYPGLKSTVLGIGADLIPGLHKADMRFDISVLPSCAQAMAVLVRLISRR